MGLQAWLKMPWRDSCGENVAGDERVTTGSGDLTHPSMRESANFPEKLS